MTRQDWDTTWMAIADSIAKRSECTRAQVGAVIVTDTNRVVSVGYNGMPAGLRVVNSIGKIKPRCEISCPRAQAKELDREYRDCLSIHAEANALLFNDRRDREGGSIYITGASCFNCAKLVANSGLARVVMRIARDEEHRLPVRSVQLLQDSGLEVIKWA